MCSVCVLLIDGHTLCSEPVAVSNLLKKWPDMRRFYNMRPPKKGLCPIYKNGRAAVMAGIC